MLNYTVNVNFPKTKSLAKIAKQRYRLVCLDEVLSAKLHCFRSFFNYYHHLSVALTEFVSVIFKFVGIMAANIA